MLEVRKLIGMRLWSPPPLVTVQSWNLLRVYVKMWTRVPELEVIFWNFELFD